MDEIVFEINVLPVRAGHFILPRAGIDQQREKKNILLACQLVEIGEDIRRCFLSSAFLTAFSDVFFSRLFSIRLAALRDTLSACPGNSLSVHPPYRRIHCA